MQSHTRAMIAASAHAVITGKKVAGIYDHAAARHMRIAAEYRLGRVQGIDADRSAKFGGTLPERFDEVDKVFVSLEAHGSTARGYDRASGGFYAAEVGDRVVQVYDYAQSTWFSFDVQVA